MEDSKKSSVESFKKFYDKNHKKLIIIPTVIVLLSILSLFLFYSAHGDIMQKDVSLKGGITATIYTQETSHVATLEQELTKVFEEINIRTLKEFGSSQQVGIIIETATVDEDLLTSTIKKTTNLELTDDNYSVEVMGSALGASFYQQMIKAILFAFIGMGIVVFIVFRSFTPSIAVVAAAFFDIIVTLSIVNLLGQRISTAGIAAFLLLIGYSVDTDILLTTRVLKRRGAPLIDRVFSSIKTGLTMTVTTVITMIVALFLATSFVLKEMFLIILIGLIIDVIVTYFFNAPILISYMKKKEHKN